MCVVVVTTRQPGGVTDTFTVWACYLSPDLSYHMIRCPVPQDNRHEEVLMVKVGRYTEGLLILLVQINTVVFTARQPGLGRERRSGHAI